MQIQLGSLTQQEIRQLRDDLNKYQMFVEGIVKLPQNSQNLGRFERQIVVAREAGAKSVRTTIIPGRRYERFKTLAEFRQFELRGEKMLERAAPIVEKHRMKLAVENHKDQRITERVALFKRLDSEYIGACLDTGNSFALLDGAYEPVEALAPYAFNVHLKDQALLEYEHGFLLGDIPLGQGSFNLKRMVTTIRKAKPELRFSLELITRDPLKVPCLSKQYFATMPDLPARHLAQAMRLVRLRPVKKLQYVSKLPLAQQLELEDQNVAQSLRYAASELGL